LVLGFPGDNEKKEKKIFTASDAICRNVLPKQDFPERTKEQFSNLYSASFNA
jgi:hypothetical protein